MPITVSGTQITFNDATTQSTAATGFDAGTVMLFAQTTAPTGWTKDSSNYNNSALRVVTGSASTGGTVDFTTAFASQTPSITISAISGSAGSTTLSTPQIPSHKHSAPAVGADGDSTKRFQYTTSNVPQGTIDNMNNTGGGGSHDHPFSFSSGTATSSAINLAVKYVDVIRASKN